MDCATNFTEKRMCLGEGTSVTESTSTEIRYRRTEDVCPDDQPAGAPCQKEQGVGCPRPTSLRHSEIYATTFGTRRPGADDKGITLVNVYPNGRREERAICFGPESIERRTCRIEKTCVRKQAPSSPPCERRDNQCMDAACMATDEERRRRDTQPALPYWHIATAAARMKQQETENQYNKERAAEAWDRYLASVSSRPRAEGQHLESKDFGCYRRNAPTPRRGGSIGRAGDGEHNRGTLHMCGGYVCDAPCASLDNDGPCKKIERTWDSNVWDQQNRHSHRFKRRHQSAPPHVGRPFYGATELEKSSLNAINHLLKAEKELRRVQFTAGSVLPQAKQYIEQVGAIHQDLKLFNTQFRELQRQTNEVLEQKGARYFHFVLQGSPGKCKPGGTLPTH